MSARGTRFSPRLWVAGAVLLGAAADAGAAVYWRNGVRGEVITVCFAGDAMTSRLNRVNQIMQYLKHYEYAVNVKFQLIGTCPAPVLQRNGTDYFAGDIRVVIPYTSVSGTGMVPGKGCGMFLENGVYNGKNDTWGSWSNSPNEAAGNTDCLYNLKLGDDPWNGNPYVNHTLHEFGHALGLAHEHERTDVNTAICTAPKYGGGISSGFLTPYDRYSVMHYRFADCGINGNYDYNGLSTWDRLGAHILYPEKGLVAEYVGSTVIETTQPVHLISAWKARGANMSYVAPAFVWKVNGSVRSLSAELYTVLPPGENTFSLTHTDFLGRTYNYQGTIKVLPAADYDEFVASIHTAASPLL
jgi:hypothetical protein